MAGLASQLLLSVCPNGRPAFRGIWGHGVRIFGRPSAGIWAIRVRMVGQPLPALSGVLSTDVVHTDIPSHIKYSIRIAPYKHIYNVRFD